MHSADELAVSLYRELRQIAAAHLRREANGHLLETTALVHEAYLRMAGQPDARWTGKAHFCGVAVQTIRRVLVDHARARLTAKRGGPDARAVALDSGILLDTPRPVELIDLNTALDELEQIDSRLARIVELRFLCGLTFEEVAAELGCDARKVQRDWRFARAWLHKQLTGEEPGGHP
ncbi:MAG: sigma-70 family RNA polymerase sigma factor [Phycisphaerales bacterium]|nr:sigma-70 family RNA polymerase sigma factor [Phycisphaerales bacterium]